MIFVNGKQEDVKFIDAWHPQDNYGDGQWIDEDGFAMVFRLCLPSDKWQIRQEHLEFVRKPQDEAITHIEF